MSSVSPNPVVVFPFHTKLQPVSFSPQSFVIFPHDLLPNLISFSPCCSLCFSHTGLLTTAQLHEAASHTRAFTLAFLCLECSLSVHMANSLTTFELYSNIISSEVCPVPPNYHLTLPTVLGLL